MGVEKDEGKGKKDGVKLRVNRVDVKRGGGEERGGGVRRGKGRGCGEHCCVVLEILKYFDPELIS